MTETSALLDQTDARGPVSTVLEQELLGELRRQGIVVWLDKDATYSRFVDDLVSKHQKGDFPFPVVGFRGSFLELLFKLEDYGSGLDKQPLLVHMPGYTEQSIRGTPVLELYEPGVRFRKGLDSLIREAATARVAPAKVDAFVAQTPSLEQADAWLASAVIGSSDELAKLLTQVGPKLLADALGDPSALARLVTAPEEVETLRRYLHTLTGMDAAWENFYAAAAAHESKPLTLLLHQLGGWALAVEYVHDLRRPPHDAHLQRLKGLSAPLVKACCDLVALVRRDSGDAYARIADEVEGFLEGELAAMSPEDLGQIDTFRGEENRVLKGAVEALGTGDWAKAKAWCEVRQGDKSFWLQRDQLRRWAWTVVAEAAEFGETLSRHTRPFATARSLDEATALYASAAFEVDRAHRRFEQRRLALLESRLSHYGALREVATALRQKHRDWADQLCKDFARLCQEQGFLPSPELRQRNLFEQVVHPLTLTSEKVAVFLIDAFRYELATELVEELKGPGTVVDLKPRLCELPSITSVGMNVLAPVTHGAQADRLMVAGIFQGFKTGEFTVRGPDDRARAMGLRSVGKAALNLKLANVCEASTAALTKEVKPHQLIVVHSKEFDSAGEASVGLFTFEALLRQIKAAWHHLQLAGVKSCVFTADHGFLLQDETTDVREFGSKRDPNRRHVLDEHPRAEAGMVNVSVAALGYEGLTGYLLFRDDTAVFSTIKDGAQFVHGGNSPQERVIPVLTVTRTRAEQGGLSEYAVEVQAQPDVMGLHRLLVRVGFAKQTTTSLGFAAARAVDLSLRVLPREQPRGNDDAEQQAIRVVFKDVVGPGRLRTGRLQLPVGDVWTEVFFGLEGPTDGRVRIEVHHPDNVENVRSTTPDTWYSVIGTAVTVPEKPSTLATAQSTAQSTASSAPTKAPVELASAPTGQAKPAKTRPPVTIPPPAAEDWAETIADEGTRKVFLHLDKHGAITELEMTHLLGSPRAFRRFSLELEVHLPKLPFRVRIETTEGGKRYVREGDR
jgi:hypothetical protein